jgi:hypothetical protein
MQPLIVRRGSAFRVAAMAMAVTNTGDISSFSLVALCIFGNVLIHMSFFKYNPGKTLMRLITDSFNVPWSLVFFEQ